MNMARSTFYKRPNAEHAGGREKADADLRVRIEDILAEFPSYGYRAELKPTAEAITKRGERFAKVRTDRASLTGCAAFRLHAAVRLFTDSRGNLRVSRRHLASTIGRSTRTARRLLCELRAVGYSIPARVFTFAEKTVRSTRKKLSAISGKESRKGFHTHSKQPKTLNGLLTEAEVEERKRKARSQLATILKQQALA